MKPKKMSYFKIYLNKCLNEDLKKGVPNNIA